MTNKHEEQARAVFERVTESYYEGDFAKYENDDYVSARQQDDFTMFLSGYHQGINYMAEKSCASVSLVGELANMLMRAKALKESNSVGNQGYELALDEVLTKAQAFLVGGTV